MISSSCSSENMLTARASASRGYPSTCCSDPTPYRLDKLAFTSIRSGGHSLPRYVDPCSASFMRCLAVFHMSRALLSLPCPLKARPNSRRDLDCPRTIPSAALQASTASDHFDCFKLMAAESSSKPCRTRENLYSSSCSDLATARILCTAEAICSLPCSCLPASLSARARCLIYARDWKHDARVLASW